MTLRFLNDSRSYDAARHSVRFWGHDEMTEAAFSVDETALKRIEPAMNLDEAGALLAFDSHRALIQSAATKIYKRGQKQTHDLTATNF
jgi:hypothetical protein